MKCPNCKNRLIELSLYSGGMVNSETPIKECSDCGQVWTCDADGVVKVMQMGCAQRFDLAA